MNKERQYQSGASAAIHETASSLYHIGAIDKKTMKEFDKACTLPSSEMKPSEIKNLREREHVSQPVFAIYLNVSRNLISDWERGIKKPSGTALRLLQLVKRYGLSVLEVTGFDKNQKHSSG